MSSISNSVAGHGFRPRRQIEFPARFQHVAEPFRGDVVAMHAEQEAIEQGPQGVVLRQAVAGADDHQQRQRAGFAAAAEDALVEHHQEAVEDRAVGVEQLVEEDQRGLRQHAFGVGHQVAFAEFADIERPEQLVGLGEAGQQVIEHAALDPPGQVLDQGALGRARRPQQEEVLAGHQGDAQQIDDFILADEGRLHRREDFRRQAFAEFDVLRGWHGDDRRMDERKMNERIDERHFSVKGRIGTVREFQISAFSHGLRDGLFDPRIAEPGPVLAGDDAIAVDIQQTR